MNLRTDQIGEIVKFDFRTAAIFKQNGIDFCCKGDRTVDEACRSKKINPNIIYSAIEELPNRKSEMIDFDIFPLDLLADYIEKTHHRYADEKIPILQIFLEKLVRVHGEKHPELIEICDLFNNSARDLAIHFKKEELILFPFIRNLISSKLSNLELNAPNFGSVENPITMMKDDHTLEGERFAKIAQLASNYAPPADACNTYRVTFAMLEEFENDLHTHIHLENNILFPKAILLESEMACYINKN